MLNVISNAKHQHRLTVNCDRDGDGDGDGGGDGKGDGKVIRSLCRIFDLFMQELQVDTEYCGQYTIV